MHTFGCDSRPRKSKEAAPPPARARSTWACAFLAVLLVSGGLATRAWTDDDEKGTGARRPNASTLEVGRVVFEQNCAICHGPLGNGRGMAGMMVRTKPRDFRHGDDRTGVSTGR